MLSHAEIKTLLPHRYPMLLVDAVRSIERWTSIVGIKNVTGNEPCFAHSGQDAEPFSHAYPCSLVLESFAQTAGILLNGRRRDAGAPEAVMLFAGLSGARFSGVEVLPGDTMEHRARLDRVLSDAAILSGEVRVEGRRIVRIDQIVVAYRSRQELESAALRRGTAGHEPCVPARQGEV
ncbi:MAG TPA: beta-hydroxyacyl-ACP dehydratase [Vicinamibacteria bacterium]